MVHNTYMEEFENMPNDEMITCSRVECGAQYPINMKSCPQCGTKNTLLVSYHSRSKPGSKKKKAEDEAIGKEPAVDNKKEPEIIKNKPAETSKATGNRSTTPPPSQSEPEFEEPDYGEPDYGEPDYGEPDFGDPESEEREPFSSEQKEQESEIGEEPEQETAKEANNEPVKPVPVKKKSSDKKEEPVQEKKESSKSGGSWIRKMLAVPEPMRLEPKQGKTDLNADGFYEDIESADDYDTNTVSFITILKIIGWIALGVIFLYAMMYRVA